ncbi:MAG TPA: tetratricopeptide repeat protein [Elusimicrobiota bacterium]|nr:tetratricopeptide repeat protein [Elusimicrobiota bacterium]
MTSDEYDKQGQEHYQNGEYEAALNAFREGLARFPRDPDLVLGVAMAHIQLGDYIQACELLEGLRRRSQGWPDVLQGLAECYLCLGQKSKAMSCVEEALGVQKDAEFLTALAVILYRHNQFKEAARCYRRGADVDPGHAPAHLGYGVCCHRTGNPGAAVEALRRAISADPSYWEAYSYLGNLLYDLRKRGESKELLGKIPVDKLWDPMAIDRLLKLYAGKEDREKKRLVEIRRREVERILQQSRERGLLDELSEKLDRQVLKRPDPEEGAFWKGRTGAGARAGAELEEALARIFDAPCAFDDGRRPKIVHFDKALCEGYLAGLTRFMADQQRGLAARKARRKEDRKKLVETADAASLLFYGAEIIREMHKRFKQPIIDKSLIGKLANALKRYKIIASASPRAAAAWTTATEALRA